MSVTKIRKSDPIRRRVTLNLTKAEWDFISERAEELRASTQKVTEGLIRVGLANVLEGNPFSEKANEIRKREKRRRLRERRAS